ncbi:MAG: hypothetical protein FWH29_09425, partial [Methanobrevibacter sp.]|nr:hypothetical protein [Methanobrevibacter sp.]
MSKINYFQNHYRLYKKRLISRFPSLYIIIKNNINIKKTIIDLKGYKAIKQNGLFDTQYYLRENQETSGVDIDPILHYLFKGFKQDKNPSSYFNGNYYLKRYSDVLESGLNPLIHYSLIGIKENRFTKKVSKRSSAIIKRKHYLIANSGLFDKKYYERNHDIGNEHPIMHYLKKGSKNNLNPNPLFDSSWYLRNNSDLKIKDPFL